MRTKKAGELGQNWNAKARWILLGHKDPDALEMERFSPTVMQALQIVSSAKYQLVSMDIRSGSQIPRHVRP